MIDKETFKKLNVEKQNKFRGGTSYLSDFALSVIRSWLGGELQEILGKTDSRLLKKLQRVEKFSTVTQVNAIINDLYSAYKILSESNRSDEELISSDVLSRVNDILNR